MAQSIEPSLLLFGALTAFLLGPLLLGVVLVPLLRFVLRARGATAPAFVPTMLASMVAIELLLLLTAMLILVGSFARPILWIAPVALLIASGAAYGWLMPAFAGEGTRIDSRDAAIAGVVSLAPLIAVSTLFFMIFLPPQ